VGQLRLKLGYVITAEAIPQIHLNLYTLNDF